MGAEGRGGGRGRKEDTERACTLGDHTLTQSAAGGALSPINGWKKKNRETLLARKMKTVFPLCA